MNPMTSRQGTEPSWGSQFRLVASEKWKAKSAAMGQPVTDALVEYARPTPGMKVLDLASGTGEPAITIASRIGSHGHVTALDLSADLLEIADKRAKARGFEHFTTRQADAHALPFPDNSFDLATSRFGVMFFRDIEKAMAEAFRVLRPGARACFLAWGSFNQPYWQSMMGIVHRQVGGPLLDPEGPNPFRFAERGSLSAVLKIAGFKDVEEEIKTIPWTWPGPPEEVWEQAQAVAVPFRPLLERVPADRWPEIHAEVYKAISQYSDGEKIEFGASVVFASGTK
jgi:SAM-dependent methyltransferase